MDHSGRSDLVVLVVLVYLLTPVALTRRLDPIIPLLLVVRLLLEDLADLLILEAQPFQILLVDPINLEGPIHLVVLVVLLRPALVVRQTEI
jgi:hypothetical protein